MHPVLIHIGPVRVFSYGVMVMLGFLAAVWWSVRSGRRRGIFADTILDGAVWIFLPALMGARLLYVALNHSAYTSVGDWFRVWEGGMSFHGGFAGGILGGLHFARSRGLSPWVVADIVAPAVALAYGIGRIGCLLNGCCYGEACSQPWAMRFPDLATGGVTPPSHPTQIYSAVAGFVIFGLCAMLDRRRLFPGATGLAFVLLYSAYRFVVEFFRDAGGAQPLTLGLTLAQVASIVMFVAGAIAWEWRGRTQRTPAVTAPEPTN